MERGSNVAHILLIGDELNWLGFAKSVFSQARYAVKTTQDVTSGWELLQDEEFELVLVDLKRVEKEETVFQKAAELQTDRNHRIVVMFPTELTPEKVGAVFKLGAHDCVDKQYDQSGLLAIVQKQLAESPTAVLIIEDDDDWRKRLVRYLSTEPQQYQIQSIGDYSLATGMLRESDFDVIILDLRLVEDGDNFEGMRLLNLLKDKPVAVIIVSAHGTVEHIRDAFKLYGIYDYMPKQHFDPDRYRQAVQEATRQRGER
jgi:DNA-binding NtrC family response regulator